jgi:hypothetical protein
VIRETSTGERNVAAELTMVGRSQRVKLVSNTDSKVGSGAESDYFKTLWTFRDSKLHR